METFAIWKEGMAFDGRAQGFNVPMDAPPPLGHNYGPGPKELVALGLAGCAGMDVIGILKKKKQFIDRFEVEAKITSNSNEHPIVFNSIELIFKIEGAVNELVALDAVQRSQTMYSGVSAMLCKFVAVKWRLIVNGEDVGDGVANFERFDEVYHTTFDG
jgi:putative redox protein